MLPPPLHILDPCIFQGICQQWPPVTRLEFNDQLKQYFISQLFSPSDIQDERQNLKELLVECK